MARALDTARFFGEPIVDARLREVDRPFVPRFDEAVTSYLSGTALDGWEDAAAVVRRVGAVVREHGDDVIYVTHGTALTLYVASRCVGVDPVSFWSNLRMPDAWRLDEDSVTRL